ncbi:MULTISPECIES: Rrf2 family transcriptional regulator [Sphingobacterium]|uniref:Transcriptional regulator n=1 Tax=Sphingobacterium corticibacter TaxID=2171749 RepID=A0A2T8HMB1_9SPHI|nr:MULTISPECIES: Rrf2 family transcriptional regulator [Sphingobacterium]PVH26574.1 transcriptional regulator [Sphingobacterium corticibacter]
MNNTRFATALHILSLLSKYSTEWLSSDWMASSINVNPVIVRKELGVLQENGWVVSRKGKEGGSRLQVKGSEIRLGDLYQAIRNSDILGKKNMNTNPKCPVGKEINNRLDSLYSETDRIVLASLNEQTLENFVDQF